MKNVFKQKTMLRIPELAALVAVIIFSMAACDNGGGSSGNNYTATAFSIIRSNFYSAFVGSTAPDDGEFFIFSEARVALESKVLTAVSLTCASGNHYYDKVSGYSLAEIEGTYNTEGF